MVASDDNSASTGFLPLFDIVNVIEALPGIGSLELISQVIVTNASGIHHGFWWEDVLSAFDPAIRMDIRQDSITGAHRSTSGSVLRSSPSNVRDLVIPHDFLVAII
jgi:hypothetical protein